MSKNGGKTFKNIEKKEKCRKPAKNVEKPTTRYQKYRKIIKTVKKQGKRHQKYKKLVKNF